MKCFKFLHNFFTTSQQTYLCNISMLTHAEAKINVEIPKEGHNHGTQSSHGTR